MGNRIAITHEAKAKLAEAFQWHESKEAGLEHEFLRAFSACFALVQRHPEIFPVVRAIGRVCLGSSHTRSFTGVKMAW